MAFRIYGRVYETMTCCLLCMLSMYTLICGFVSGYTMGERRASSIAGAVFLFRYPYHLFFIRTHAPHAVWCFSRSSINFRNRMLAGGLRSKRLFSANLMFRGKEGLNERVLLFPAILSISYTWLPLERTYYNGFHSAQHLLASPKPHSLMLVLECTRIHSAMTVPC